MANTNFIIDPSKVSHEDIKQSLKEYLDTLPDNAKWKDFFDSQAGNVIVELVSGMATYLKFTSITSRREAYPRHADNRSSLVGYAESVGYSVYRGRNQIVKLTITPNMSGVLPRYSTVGAVKDKDLVVLQDYVVNSGQQVEIEAIIGNLKTESQTVNTVAASSFRFNQPDVSEDVRVLLNDVEKESSNKILDMINEKFVVQSNVNSSVDIMYNNLDTYDTQYSVGDILKIEYVELSEIEFEESNMSFDYGTLDSYTVSSVYKQPEEIESIRINSQLFSDTQYVIRGRKDYSKVFKLLESSIVSTSYKDISPAVVQLYYINDDLSLFQSTEKENLVLRLSNQRPMGVEPPTIADPIITFLNLSVTLSINSSEGNPTQEVETILSSYEKTLEAYIDFEDVEQSLEGKTFCKIARIEIKGYERENNTYYPKGFTIEATNDLVHMMKRVIYKSGASQPSFPTTLNETVIDGSLIWTCCKEIGVCDEVPVWASDTEYPEGSTTQPSPANGFGYCLTDYINSSSSSSEIQNLVFSPNNPNSGTFRLEYDNSGELEETTDLLYDADASAVQDALNGLSGLSEVQVSGTIGTGFEVSFLGDDANKPQPLLTLDHLGTNEKNCISFDIDPNVGIWRLQFGAAATGNLNYDISNGDLKTALEALSSIGVGNVEVSTGVGEVKYSVEFIGALGKQDLTTTLSILANDLRAAAIVTATPTTAIDGQDPDLGEDEVQNISFNLVPDTGEYSITFEGKTTSLLAFDADAATILTALEALTNVVSGDLSVTGNYTDDFVISCLNTGNYAKQEVDLITVASNTLTSSTQAVTITVTETTEGAPPFIGSDETQNIVFNYIPDAGSYKIKYDTESTPLLNFNESAASIQVHLNNITSLSEVIVVGDYDTGFNIEYQGADGKKNHPLIEIIENTLSASSVEVVLGVNVCQEGKKPANNLDVSGTPIDIIVSTVEDAINPEPDWDSAVGIEDICNGGA